MHSSLQNLYIQSGCLHCLLLKQFPRSGVGLSQRHVLRVYLRHGLLPEREYQQLCGVSLSLPDLLEQYYLLQLFLVTVHPIHLLNVGLVQLLVFLLTKYIPTFSSL